MIEDIIKMIENSKERIVFLPKSDILYLDSFKYMYGDCIAIIDNSLTEYSDIVDKLNQSNIKEMYFTNFPNIYRKILPELDRKITKNEILLINIANLTNNFTLSTFFDVCEFYERKLINKIYALDTGMYEMLKHAKFNVDMLELKFKFDKKSINTKHKNSNSIGILSNDFDPVHNFYNMLSAIRLVKHYDKVKLISNMAATTDFFNHFDINHELCDNLEEVMSDNYVNLYCNFTNTNPCLAIKSMDMGIPCILGNTNLFDNTIFTNIF